MSPFIKIWNYFTEKPSVRQCFADLLTEYEYDTIEIFLDKRSKNHEHPIPCRRGAAGTGRERSGLRCAGYGAGDGAELRLRPVVQGDDQGAFFPGFVKPPAQAASGPGRQGPAGKNLPPAVDMTQGQVVQPRLHDLPLRHGAVGGLRRQGIAVERHHRMALMAPGPEA